MKKTNNQRKAARLAIKSETLKVLSDDELNRAGGAGYVNAIGVLTQTTGRCQLTQE